MVGFLVSGGGMRIENVIRLRALGAGVMLAMTLSGCQQDAASVAKSRSSEVFAASDPSNQLSLQPMLAEEVEEHPLAGDLGCYFADSPASDPLLLARGFLQSPGTTPTMLVKFADAVVEGSTTETGGYEALLDGGTFDTAALVVDVARIDGEAPSGGGLQPARAALRVRQAGQPDVVLQGYWTCGA
jgi:hypothetical protein